MYDIPSVTPACFLTLSLYFGSGVQGLFDQVEYQFQGVGGGCLVGDDVDVLEQPFRETVQIVSVTRHRRSFVFDFRMQPVMPAHLHEGPWMFRRLRPHFLFQVLDRPVLFGQTVG